ncbi:Hsp20/alpha crystallin family protein [Pedobacter sp.]|jgi:HSP20 family protein|uniref:Hsp20/alpha crystallin family protein n=1 Tax=Pedobacter sp. TaxID=1411316 RepID=UPI002B639730|nr:Hsp20/alpha crystallin family protein [Pedobacter sp.]HWW38484.1 Hsp20/alpha crystallin family protein [Pedobacter sp.]
MFNEHRHHSSRMHRGCGRRGGRFGGPFGAHFRGHGQDWFGQDTRRVPANIEETENSFLVHLFAPALVKAHLKVATKDDVLTISYTPDENEQTETKFSRREYSNGAFERSFALNGKVMTDDITASYADGVLKVVLPKNPETNIPGQDIPVD